MVLRQRGAASEAERLSCPSEGELQYVLYEPQPTNACVEHWVGLGDLLPCLWSSDDLSIPSLIRVFLPNSPPPNQTIASSLCRRNFVPFYIERVEQLKESQDVG